MKKLTNKLRLNKMTITNLETNKMNNLVGGISGLKCLTKSCQTMNTCSPTCRYC